MSTFFRSAAMSLLSKTLQALLYKYLSDVDVEGVALPSLYNAEGHSGWGVRLSNVKLREGATLMNLPGKPRRRGKRRKESKSSSTSMNENGLSQQEEDGGKKDPPGERASQLPSRTSFVGGVEEEQTVKTSLADSFDTASVKKKPTLSRWFSWSSRAKEAPRSGGKAEQQSGDKADQASTEQPGEIQPREVKAEMWEDASAAVSELANDSHSVLIIPQNVFNDTTSETDPLIGTHSHGQSLNGEDTGRPTQEKENNDEEEPRMILRLGNNGSIGVLDVRLIGKTMHVLMEDASLTIEVVQLPQNQDETGDKEPVKPPAASTDRKPPKQLPTKTVGDRVLAEIALARVFSSIPNLLLRDIRIRVVIQGDEPTKREEPENEIGPNDTVLEFNIELLSVTDGQDFLANFRAGSVVDDRSISSEESGAAGEAGDDIADLSGVDRTNEFEVKRIRTGRGPDGGITMKVFSGSDLVPSVKKGPAGMWARQSWRTETNNCALRISGLDLQARMFMGKKEDVSLEGDIMFEDFNVDSLLFGGVDYIAPGPQPPLPPIMSQDNGDLPDDDHFWTIPGATSYITDSNGVQRCGLASAFHRVGRGLRPSVCKNDHLPCERCSACWTAAPGTPLDCLLDSSTPMAGLVLHASLRDALEINLDRQTLEQIGLLLDLFTKKKPPIDEAPVENGGELSVEDFSERTGLEGSQRSNRSTRSFFSRNSNNNLTDDSARGKLSRAGSFQQFDDSFKGQNSVHIIVDDGDNWMSTYPLYMQPEKIQILGIHVSEIRLRIHVLRNDELPDTRLSFCYWDLGIKCLTMDIQLLSASERPFTDVRLDVGNLTTTEFRGAEKKKLASLGLRQRVIEFDDMTVETLMTREPDNMRPPWPSTAAALLDLPPPLETLVYETRERHAVQLRYFTVSSSGDDHKKKWGHASIRLGSTFAEMPFALKNNIQSVIGEARSLVFGSPQSSSNLTDVQEETTENLNASENKPVESRLKYKIHFEGGKVKMDPLFEVSFPYSTVTGEKSSLSGISFETFLQSVKVQYSKPAPQVAEHGLSLQQIANLPDNVRLRLLLFLSDLKPLELALGINTEANSFLRCRAVNKGLVKAARKHTRRLTPAREDSRRLSQSGQFKRQELMTELMKLGDEELEDLWIIHMRNKRRNGGDARR